MSVEINPTTGRCACKLCAGEQYERWRKWATSSLRYEPDWFTHKPNHYLEKLDGEIVRTVVRLDDGAYLLADVEQPHGGIETAIARAWHVEHAKCAQREKARRGRVCIAMPDLAWQVVAYGALQECPAMDTLRGWSGSGYTMAVLAGPPGTGKTVLAVWTAHKYFEDPKFLVAAKFARMSRYDDAREELVEGRDELILDDLGSEYLDAKGSFKSDLDELIDAAYRNQRVVVITTNLDAKQFKKRYGERVMDRLRECAQWIPVLGPSRRGATP